MFFCAKCWSAIKIDSEKGNLIHCFGPGNHIDPNDVPELTGKNVSIVLRNGIETFMYYTQGLEQVCIPLEAHLGIVRQDPPGENAPALFKL